MKKFIVASLSTFFAINIFAADVKDFVEQCPKIAKVLYENDSIRMLFVKQAKWFVRSLIVVKRHDPQ